MFHLFLLWPLSFSFLLLTLSFVYSFLVFFFFWCGFRLFEIFLSSHFPGGSFWSTFKIYYVQFFFFTTCAFSIIFKKQLCNPYKDHKYINLFSLKSFIILPLTFRYMIFEVIFVSDVRKVSNLIFLHVDIQLFQNMLKKLLFSHWVVFGTPVESQLTINVVMVYFWTSSSSLICIPILMPILQSWLLQLCSEFNWVKFTDPLHSLGNASSPHPHPYEVNLSVVVEKNICVLYNIQNNLIKYPHFIFSNVINPVSPLSSHERVRSDKDSLHDQTLAGSCEPFLN